MEWVIGRLVLDVIRVLVSFAILYAVLYFICRYHWGRMILSGFLLAVSGAVVLIPIVLALMSLETGNPFSAIIQFICGLFFAVFWYFPAKAAYDWVKRHIAINAFWLPWNAR